MLLKLYEDNPNDKEISEVVNLLENGGVIIYPTDTIYAIGCSINSVKAVQKVAAIKGLKLEKANLSIICSDISHVAAYGKMSNDVFKLMKRTLPGPFTYILKATSKLPNVMLNRRKTIGIRIPDNYIVHLITEKLGCPLMTTSVHDDDDIVEYMTDPSLIEERYGARVDMVIDGGYGNNVASTVIDCTNDEPEIIRQGIGIL